MVTTRDGVRFRLLVAVAVVVGGGAWVVLKVLRDSGVALPATSWLTVLIYVAFALALLVAGRPVKRLVAGRATRAVNPLYAARVLAMAQAAALAGAATFGWYVAQAVVLLPDIDIVSQRTQMLVLAGLAVAAAGLAGVGLLVQRWCRLDDDHGRTEADGEHEQLS